MTGTRAGLVLGLLFAIVLTAGSSVGSDAASSPDLQPVRYSTVEEVAGPTVVAVGDIACPPGEPVTEDRCRHGDTASLAQSYTPDVVVGLGDLQYESGALSDFEASYDLSWGALKSVTKPVPGNHEYRTADAAGYYAYFDDQSPGHPGYYAFNVANWRIYALNSNCAKVNCERQVRWLNRNMTANPRRCSAIMSHHPRFSSGGEHGSSTVVKPFWRIAVKHRADIALGGHDHDYERFRKMDAAGEPSPSGMVSFVSGAGGKSLYEFGTPLPGSLARDNHAPGVLALVLGKRRYSFEYRTIDGQLVDSGIRRCV
ncbi:MAG: metallophosphoesterase [Actinomycetota bacterium]|nr:metallophosphoesterase [Actinomycetota bacterium]